jgi:hypothetical protein
MSQHLRRFLDAGDALARLQDHAGRLRRLQGALEAALPRQLASQYRVGNLIDDELVVFAPSGAAAVRLKQMIPSLIERLRMAGHAVGSIRVKILCPDAAPSSERPATLRQLSGTARDHLTDFAASLPADSELRDSIERLARRARTQ